MTLVVFVTTYLTIVIGELVPKQLALRHPEKIAAIVSIPMLLMTRFTYPFVKLLTISTDLILRLIKVRTPTEPEATEDEILMMIDRARIAGTVTKAEQAMIDGVLELGDLR